MPEDEIDVERILRRPTPFEERGFRVLILGAGFSRPAGLPLGRELWPEVLAVVDREFSQDNVVRCDLGGFVTYKIRTLGTEIGVESIDFEEFVAFLDLEHFLNLRGSDTWTSAGNQSQLIIRWAIGHVIHDRLERLHTIPDPYLRFAERLQPSDFVLTLNYDTLLETALDFVGKSYRLFPTRYSHIGVTANTVDSSDEEVAVLKLHGSIDWFDRTEFEESLYVAEQTAQATGTMYQPGHPVFGHDRVVEPRAIVDGPRPPDDGLAKLYRIADPGPLYRSGQIRATPFLLSPSSNKVLYTSPLREFFDGAGRSGALNLGLGIVGFSLPEHDEYLRQILYRLTRNYTDVWWHSAFAGRFKSLLRLVDYRTGTSEVGELRQRYSFLNWDRTELFLDGFGMEAVEFLFAPSERPTASET